MTNKSKSIKKKKKRKKKMINATKNMKMNVNLNSLKKVSCPNCNNFIFRTDSSIFKTLPSIQSPTGKAQLIQIPILVCSACNCPFLIKENELFAVDLEDDAYEDRTNRS